MMQQVGGDWPFPVDRLPQLVGCLSLEEDPNVQVAGCCMRTGADMAGVSKPIRAPRGSS